MQRSRRTTILVLGSASVTGIGVAVSPTVATAALLGAGALLLATAWRRHLRRGFLISLGMLLAGYAFGGRGFAYTGYWPVFIGEIVLGMGLLTFVFTSARAPLLHRPIVWLLLGYAAWGAVRTLPYLGTYGAQALRDAVIWGYAVFALILAALLPHPDLLQGTVRRYRTWLPWFLLWAPAIHLAQTLVPGAFPQPPWSDVPLVQLKPGDTAVHLAGALSFLALGLARHERNGSTVATRSDWVWWGPWLAGFLVVGSENRGGLLAMLASGALVFCFRPSWWLKLAAVVVVVAAIASVIPVNAGPGQGRSISAEQIVANLESVIAPDEAGKPDLAGTRQWRLQWWNAVVNYTVLGPYFWTGKGFGVNLADDDGFQVSPDHSLRSPHNSHLTILARAGVPGLVLWILLQTVFGVSLVRAHARARRVGRDLQARVYLWVLAYWVAFLVNGMFDVFLEGPQGGIWFWSLVGFGIAATEVPTASATEESPSLRRDARLSVRIASSREVTLP